MLQLTQFIKEAMACNLPIISTPVGDVSWLVENVRFCEVIPHDVFLLSATLIKIIRNEQRSNGRNAIIELGLPIDNVAKKIVDIYKLNFLI